MSLRNLDSWFSHLFNNKKKKNSSLKVGTEKELLESISRDAFNVAISRQVKASVENILESSDKITSPNLLGYITQIKIVANAISIKQRYWIVRGEGFAMQKIASHPKRKSRIIYPSL